MDFDVLNELQQARADKRLVVLKPPLEIQAFDVIAVWHPRVDKDVAHRWLRNRLADIAKFR